MDDIEKLIAAHIDRSGPKIDVEPLFSRDEENKKVFDALCDLIKRNYQTDFLLVAVGKFGRRLGFAIKTQLAVPYFETRKNNPKNASLDDPDIISFPCKVDGKLYIPTAARAELVSAFSRVKKKPVEVIVIDQSIAKGIALRVVTEFLMCNAVKQAANIEFKIAGFVVIAEQEGPARKDIAELCLATQGFVPRIDSLASFTQGEPGKEAELIKRPLAVDAAGSRTYKHRLPLPARPMIRTTGSHLSRPGARIAKLASQL